ncbi:hypothetical protein HBI13_031660 [Parastagonospora nodorum]|nr:hypothetical protein HBI13_031660 [Parastagonospora nodorum]KAH4081834.1 hypothetical protein HBH48_193980 [Parastagonospora nodorum]KAH6340387.1 hypothetical protein HBI36_195360 [Parastagonospora nodorum]KAH6360757.1 hypothetical protein HBI34_194620 [Parastagonospora nodorum]
MNSPTSIILRQPVWAFSQLQGLGIHLSVFLQENGPQLAGHLTGSAASAIFACGIEGTHKGGTAPPVFAREHGSLGLVIRSFELGMSPESMHAAEAKCQAHGRKFNWPDVSHPVNPLAQCFYSRPRDIDHPHFLRG